MGDSHTRSIVKGVTWRVIATGTTVILVYLFTENLAISLGIGVIEPIIKIILYYGHERAWNNIKWGKILFTVSGK
jgi:adenylylsulfate kinase